MMVLGKYLMAEYLDPYNKEKDPTNQYIYIVAMWKWLGVEYPRVIGFVQNEMPLNPCPCRRLYRKGPSTQL